MKYGIHHTPHNLAYLNHLMACDYCNVQSGKYCEVSKNLWIAQNNEAKRIK